MSTLMRSDLDEQLHRDWLEYRAECRRDRARELLTLVAMLVGIVVTVLVLRG